MEGRISLSVASATTIAFGVAMAGAWPGIASAQAERLDEWPLTVVLTSETLGYYPNAVHPGVEVGTELRYVREGPYELVQSLQLGTIYHPAVMVGAYLNTSVVNRLQADVGVYGEIGVGVGGQLTTIPGTTYAAHEDTLVAGGNDPRPMARVVLSVAAGFDLISAGAPGVRIFLRYAETLLAPFATGNSLTLFVSSQLALGISVPLSPETWQ